MTKEEIKAKYTMKDVAAMYGIRPNRAGFCSCPFHAGDRTPSLKLYERDFNCYACGANGDVFTFVQLMDDCDFKTAFKRLGGNYKAMTRQDKRNIYRAVKRRQTDKNKALSKCKKGHELSDRLTECRKALENTTPMSDGWAKAFNKLQYAEYLYSEFYKLET